MRIGISFKNLNQKRTGADIVMTELAKYLWDLDSRNQYFLFFTPPDLNISVSNFHIVKTIGLWNNPIFNIFWHQVFFWLYIYKYHLDVVHVPYLRIPVICPCILITTIHDLAEYRTPGHYNPIRRFYRRNILRSLSKKVDHFITVSNNSKKDIEELWEIPSYKITVIYNGVSNRFHPMDKEYCQKIVSEKYGLSNDYILYVGAIEHPNKNLVRLIMAYGHARRYLNLRAKLVICGMKRGNPQPVFDTVEKEKLKNEVVFLDYVPLSDLVLLYNGAQALIYPSLYEGFGLPPVEAMTCGIPVGCSNTASLPEIVGQAALLFDPFNVKDIADTMVQLVTDENLRKVKIELGFERTKMFSWEAAAHQTKAVYEKVFEERK